MSQQQEVASHRRPSDRGAESEQPQLLPSPLDRSHMLALLRLGDFADDAFIATDPDGCVTYMNRAAERLFGTPRSGMPRLSVIIPLIRSGLK